MTCFLEKLGTTKVNTFKDKPYPMKLSSRLRLQPIGDFLNTDKKETLNACIILQ